VIRRRHRPAHQPSDSRGYQTCNGYRERSQQFSLEFASYDIEAELFSLIEECVDDTVRECEISKKEIQVLDVNAAVAHLLELASCKTFGVT
jgi:hypothetical protein